MIKKSWFFAVSRQKCRLKLTVKKFQGISNLTISADLKGFWLLKNLKTGKNSFRFLKRLFLDITSANKTLQLSYICKYFEIVWVKDHDKPQNTTVNISSYRSYYLLFNYWPKFPLNNHQPSKSENYNRQLSKLPPCSCLIAKNDFFPRKSNEVKVQGRLICVKNQF